MEFASSTFLFIFLPAVFLLFAVIPRCALRARLRSWLLIAASLVFYAWGEPLYVLLMLLSAAFNYLAARLIRGRLSSYAKAILIVSAVFNIGMLAVFKYSGFAVSSFNSVTGLALPVPETANPLGISFFTFQALGYVIDVYRGETCAERNFGDVLLFISFFPQLLQGPIIKYDEVRAAVKDPVLSAEGAAEGLRLFIIGLGMKLIIANTLGRVTSFVFALPKEQLNIAFSWAGAVCFLLQIYFDFAGYSQMAIGLGRMFGFTIPKNFNYPYISKSMTEFWRRWHITLSRWFKENVYIPLGGNRRSTLRTGVNKLTVFLLTGLWHGANWTFVVWGAYNGAFLLAESCVKKTRFRLPKPIARFYTLLAVTVGFVIFNSPDMAYAAAMIKSMFAGFAVSSDTLPLLSRLFGPIMWVTLAAAVLGSTPLLSRLTAGIEAKSPKLAFALKYGSALALFVLCAMYIALGNYNPSIYTQF